ncbi:TPA: hypothetical protein HA278_04585 [Candidatus Woesearchaeota archaeon]|nr:hypothetical protein [Candidatus Woesearchaeota archaeon]
MEETLLDEKTKTYLIACIVTGIDVVYDPREFMVGLVDHMNSIERPYWTEGDEDGVIIHDKYDQPILSVMYTGQRMIFGSFEEDPFTAIQSRQNTAFAVLNIIDYLRKLELEFCPSILGSEARVVQEQMALSDDTTDTEPSDWAI